MSKILEVIEEKTASYISGQASVLPKYVLLDTKTHHILTEQLRALSRYAKSDKGIFTEPDEQPARLKTLVLNSAPWGLRVLEVASDEPLIEIAG
jgi:hypothetical protein